jgi:hypothetical protein
LQTGAGASDGRGVYVKWPITPGAGKCCEAIKYI